MILSALNRLSNTGMMGFLFISGYGLYSSFKQKGLDGYWERKFRKLIPPIMIANLMGIIVHLLFMRQSLSRQEIYEGFVLREVYYPVFNSELWYIHLLLAWYVIFYLITWLIKGPRLQMAALAAASLIMWYFTPEVYGLSNDYSLAFPIGVFLGYGILYRKKRLDMKYRRVGVLVLGVAAYLCLVFMNGGTRQVGGYAVNFWIWTALTNILLLLAVLAIVVIAERISTWRRKEYFLYLGKVSLLIYVFQRPLILELLEYYDDGVLKWILAAVGAFVMFGICHVYLVITKRSAIWRS